jgi:hypothetical protein
MLDAHPALCIPPETHFIPAVAVACRDATDPISAFLRALESSPYWLDQHVDVNDLRERLSHLPAFDITEGLRLFYQLCSEREGKPRWGDKSFYLPCMTLIQELLPEARFVHIVRDGRDVALSTIPLWFGPNSIEECARVWTDFIRQARVQAAELRWYMEIRYEDLVLDPEGVLRRVCDFIALPWDAKMLGYYKRAPRRLAELTTMLNPYAKRILAAHERRYIHAATRRPPDPGRLFRWMAEMTSSDRGSYEAIACDMLKEFGYAVGSSPQVAPP